jgi:hypothetical protein
MATPICFVEEVVELLLERTGINKERQLNKTFHLAILMFNGGIAS